MGAGSLLELFDEKYYTGLEGGILESFGRMFTKDLKVYVYPMLDPNSGELMTSESLPVEASLKQLFGYLCNRGFITDLDNFDAPCLNVRSRDVLRRIKDGDRSWETMVPPSVADVIKRRGYFDYVPEEMALHA